MEGKPKPQYKISLQGAMWVWGMCGNSSMLGPRLPRQPLGLHCCSLGFWTVDFCSGTDSATCMRVTFIAPHTTGIGDTISSVWCTLLERLLASTPGRGRELLSACLCLHFEFFFSPFLGPSSSLQTWEG